MADSEPKPSSIGEAKELFLDALELEGSERERFLADLARATPDAATRVVALLEAHEGQAAGALESLGSGVRGLLEEAFGEKGAIVGDYELFEEIASGASGVVWRARQRSLDRVVALKVLRAGRLAGRREVDRFRAEAETVARFHHPHVVPVYEVGEHEGRHYFSMRHYEGGSLAGQVGPETPWEPRSAAEMVATISTAVHHAHQRGLLHRDLKPSNVLLDEQGQPAVADFGVATNIDDTGVAAVTATLAGTPAYMAPEQTGAGGVEHGELTVATDVWALGCILYELLSGRPPFEAETLADILRKVRDEPPFPLRALAPSTPRDLETIALCCLAKEPARRYASANALAVDLNRWLEHEPILARRAGPLQRILLAWRRSPVVSTLTAAVIVLVTAFALAGSWASIALANRLRDSFIGEARAVRLAGGQGRRERSLELLARANDIRWSPQLRDEAIASLAISDVGESRSMPFRLPAGQVDISDDLNTCVFQSGNEGMVVMDVPSGRVLHRLQLESVVPGVCLSLDGSMVAGQFPNDDGDFVARMWSVATGEELYTGDCNWASIARDFSPDNSLFLAGGRNGVFRVLDTSTNEVVFAQKLGRAIRGLDLHEDGRRVALAVSIPGEDPDILVVLDWTTGEELRRHELPGYPYDADWLRDGESVLVSTSDFAAHVYAPGDEDPSMSLLGHRAEIVSTTVSSTQDLALTTSWDRTVRLWDLQRGEELAQVSGFGLRIPTDGRHITYRTHDTLEIAPINHGDVFKTYVAHEGKSPRGGVFLVDETQAITFGGDGALLWDVESGARIGWLTREYTRGVEVDPDGEWLYLAQRTGLERRKADRPLTKGEMLLDIPVRECDLSADGSTLAVNCRDHVAVIDTATGAVRLELEGYDGMTEISVGGTGRIVTSSSWRGWGISIWDAEQGLLLRRLAEDKSVVGSSISPDERHLLLNDGLRCSLYTLPELELIHTIDRGVGWRESAVSHGFSPDSQSFCVTLSVDRTVLFDIASLSPIARFEAQGCVFDGPPIFSANGSQLAFTSPENRWHVWDLVRLRRRLDEAGINWE